MLLGSRSTRICVSRPPPERRVSWRTSATLASRTRPVRSASGASTKGTTKATPTGPRARRPVAWLSPRRHDCTLSLFMKRRMVPKFEPLAPKVAGFLRPNGSPKGEGHFKGGTQKTLAFSLKSPIRILTRIGRWRVGHRIVKSPPGVGSGRR